jgi:hypothetical protein
MKNCNFLRIYYLFIIFCLLFFILFFFASNDGIDEKQDDGWPESVEEQGLLLLVWRHNFTNNI